MLPCLRYLCAAKIFERLGIQDYEMWKHSNPAIYFWWWGQSEKFTSVHFKSASRGDLNQGVHLIIILHFISVGMGLSE